MPAVDERPHGDGPAGGRELDRVGEEIADELDESLVVAANRRHLGEVRLECELACARERGRGLDQLATDLVEAHRREVELQSARIEACDEEQVADQALQPLGAAVDDGQEAASAHR